MIKKWSSLIAGIIIQAILGGVYAWSAFGPRLLESYGITKSQGGLIFGLCIAVFSSVLLLSGRCIAVYGAKVTAVIGAVFYSAGFFVASFSNGSFPILLLSLGIITGVGIGFGYVCPLTVGMKWFPNNKGLVTGFAVAGFGGGAVCLSVIANASFNVGVGILSFYRYWAAFSGVALILMALIISEPKNNNEERELRVTPFFKVLTKPFMICAVGIFAGTFAGLLINGNLVSLSMESGVSPQRSALVVSVFAVGNALGRICWGMLFDRLSFKSIPLSLLCLFCVVCSLLLNATEALHIALIGLLGFFFGANFVVYAASIVRYFGQPAFPLLYPFCFLFYGVAGLIAPGVGGYLADLTGTFSLSVIVSALVLLIAGVLSMVNLSVFSMERLSSDG